MVVEQGLCKRLNIIKLIPVSSVQPPAKRISAVATVESSSNITPAPSPTSISPRFITVSIRIVGITISFAGIAII